MVDDVWFEHAPGRRSRVYTSDSTAFDVLVRYRTPQGSRGFIAIEIKYSEGMVDPLAGLKTRYDELSRMSGLYLDPDSKVLRKNPLQQLWREHLLAQSMLYQGLYAEGILLLIGPEHNWRVQMAAARYQCELSETTARHVGFGCITLEQIIAAMAEEGDAEHASKLHRRYCDWWQVDGEIHLTSGEADESPEHERCEAGAKVLFLPAPRSPDPAS
jgi:hypothetical protein